MPNLLLDLLYYFNWFIIVFFVVLNGFYLIQMIAASNALKHYNNGHMVFSGVELPPQMIKPFSLIVPAYNEEATILDSLNSLLSLDYREYEIVLVNDGSADSTLELLRKEYELAAEEVPIEYHFKCKPIKAVYFSKREPRLVVVDKENGGKADAQNAGLNVVRYPYAGAVDADSVLSADSMRKMMAAFISSARTVGVGGIVRIANGCTIKNGDVSTVRMPEKWLPRIQVIEYLRAFLFGRMGLSRLNILMIISGAFGVFRMDALSQNKGWNPDSLGEDMDLVVRMHRDIRENKKNTLLQFIPDPVCWTQAPEDLGSLASQRDRWQRGLMQTLFENLIMFFNPRYGRIGMVGYPYFFIFEMLGGFIELSGYFMTILAFYLGVVNIDFMILFFAVAMLLGLCISLTSVALEEVSYRRYSRTSDLWRMLASAVFENFGYRQLHMFWRLKGMFKYIFGIGGRSWGTIKRSSFNKGDA